MAELNQLSFLDLTISEPAPAPPPPIIPTDRRGGLQASFDRFHKANPHVYQLLRGIALRAARRGRKVGIKAVYEMARWYFMVETEGEPYKLNNNYTAYYARLLMAQEPELDGFFEIRQQRSI